jgi:undecaprenyl-diphosphatase
MPRPALTTALIVTGGAAVVIALSVLVVTGVSRPFDRALIELIRAPDLIGPLSPLRVVTEAGSTWAVAVVALLIIPIAILIGPWMHGVIGAVVVGLASIANALVKEFIARERPDLLEPIIVERGFSFPSGHAVLGMTAWGVLAVLVARSRLPRSVRVVVIAALVALVLLIGMSRVYLGVHYPTDVLAGWTAGAVIVFVFARLTRGVSRAPVAAAADEDRAAPRSDPPVPG